MAEPNKRVFVTGIAGFIGFHVAKTLKNQGHFVIGIDNFNSYYDPTLKRARQEELKTLEIEVIDAALQEKEKIASLLDSYAITHFIHLAAQAGVRYSIQNPQTYIENNIEGFLSVLETLKDRPKIKLIYASSSSVYGFNKKTPFAETDLLTNPANIYAASKIANESMAQAYHHLYGIHAIGLRYFTVYGPWGRPDMAYFLFARSILENKPLFLRNSGQMQRDFTYVDDIASGTISALDISGCEIFNLGNSKPAQLMDLVSIMEKKLQKQAKKIFIPMEKGEPLLTFADLTKSQKNLGFSPVISLETGLEKFLDWYLAYYHAKDFIYL